MNKLGQKIKSLNNELNKNIKLLDSWNLLDQDKIKIYIHYLKEIINNNEKAIIFNKKLSDEAENRNMYDDINLYQLNYEEMSKNEDNKYIIINLSKDDFNKISSISYSVCKEFGYMKEELIGHSSDILFPEIFNDFRKIFFEKKVEEYKQKLFHTNKIINSEIWTGDCYGINKIKFLIQFKAKWTIISIEDEKLYGVGNIYLENKKIIDSRELEIIYILTDLNLKIQNYSSNAPDLLNINAHVENNNMNINEYISEFKENEKEESNISNISNQRKKIYKNNQKRFSRPELIKKYKYLEKNIITIIWWKKKEVFEVNNKNERENQKRFNFTKLLNSYENDTDNIAQIKSNPNRASVGIFQKNKFDKFQIVSPKYRSEMNRRLNNDNSQKENVNKNPGKLFLLKVEEAKLHKYNVGYIFILRPYKQKNEVENNSTSKDLINMQENKNMNMSDISIVNFGEDKKKFNCTQLVIGPFNLNNQNNDIFLKHFELENDYQFTFDVKDIAYKQFKYIDNKKEYSLYKDLKEKAIEKITKEKKQFQIEEIEEEEESSEYENTEDEEEINSLSSKDISNEKSEEMPAKEINKNLIEETKENSNNEKDSKKKLNKKISSNQILHRISIKNTSKNTLENNKKKEEDFYHINFDKVTLYIFNYSLGFVEIQKGHAHKISQVTNIMNSEKEKLKHSSSRFLVNPKLMRGKKKLNIKKEEDIEHNTHCMTSLKLKEIYKNLSSPKKETVINQIISVSFIIFALIIGTRIVNILVYYKIKNNIYTFFILIEKSEYLYQNLLFEITIVKEMLLLNNSFYTNPINNNKEFFYQLL